MKLTVYAAVCGLFAAPAFAVTVSVQGFNADNLLADQYNALKGNISIVEDFEGFAEGEMGTRVVEADVDAGFGTAVGTFSTLGGVGAGSSVTGTGLNLAVRDGNVGGRTDTTAAITGDLSADQFLDSNDTLGVRYDVNTGGSLFSRILLTLTDAADAGATLTIVGADTGPINLASLSNGNRQLVHIVFSEQVREATLLFSNSQLDDGFSLDDVGVNEVPLPASALLLLGGLGGMSLLRRRQKV